MMAFAYKYKRSLKAYFQHFYSLHFVVDCDLNNFPEMSQVPSKQFGILNTPYRLLRWTCSYPCLLPMYFVIKMNHRFSLASNNRFNINVILQISLYSAKNLIITSSLKNHV